MWLSGMDPGRAGAEAKAVLDEAGNGRHDEAAAVALRASALAARELGDLALAEERLRQAISTGAAFPRRVAQARMSLVTIRAQLGDPENGLRLADLAERDLSGTDLARLGVQRSVALTLLGRHHEAVHHCDQAIGLLDSDPKFQAGGLLNRGLAFTYLEEYDKAARDLSECAAIARSAGLGHIAMLAEGNLPFVAARRGDISAAFDSYRAAEGALFGYPERLAVMRVDFAEALVSARLPGEARALLEQAVPDLAASGAQAGLAEARLLLAQVEILTGDPRQARVSALTARSELIRQGRGSWAPLADEVALRARLAQEPPCRAIVTELLACASELAEGGWASTSSAVRLTAAETAKRLGDLVTARAQLDLLAEPSTRTVIRQHARAMRLHLDGDRSGALAAAWSGLLAALPQRRTATVDFEARAHMARAAEDLAEFGMRMALETEDAWTVLAWAERWRALVRGNPSPSASLGGDGSDPARRSGTGARPADSGEMAGGSGETASHSSDESTNGIGDSEARPFAGALIEFVRSGDELVAVMITCEGGELRSRGSYSWAAEATRRVRYGLRRRNLRDVHAEDGLARELIALDERLLGSLDLADGPVVVVPTGALHSLPWPLLPSLRGRPVSVSTEATSWLTIGSAIRAHPPGPRRPSVMVVAGPGLEHAGAEAEMVARSHPGAARIPATKAGVIAALERADVLHVAAHGMFSPRSPMLSRITLDDEPLMAYDLLRLRRAPRLVILSACDSGMAHAPVDGAVLGLAGAFLDRGAACVVAGVVPVRDDEALTLMTAFHTLLAGGHSPAEALGTAADQTGIGGFICFSRGNLDV